MSGKVREYKGLIVKGGQGGMIQPVDLIYKQADTTRVTAIDSRDVGPLVEAARYMCRASAAMVNAKEDHELEAAQANFDTASDHLAEALAPFLDEETEAVEGIQGGSE